MEDHFLEIKFFEVTSLVEVLEATVPGFDSKNFFSGNKVKIWRSKYMINHIWLIRYDKSYNVF